MPVSISSPQIVKISDFVFVGGGFLNRYIFQYSINDDAWTTLPQCPATEQGLTTLNGELISVGGKNSQRITNIVYTFSDGQWKKVLPAMPTPRFHFSTVSHNNELIVAAGGVTGRARDGEISKTRAVEIYIKDRQWYVTEQLPIWSSNVSTCVIGDTCYKMGGMGNKIETCMTLHISLSNFTKQVVPATAMPEIRGEWSVLKTEYPLIYLSLVEIEGKLIAMGGSYDTVLRRGTRFISSYDFAADVWVECQGAQLPVPLYRPGVVKLPGNKVMIIGGQPEMKQFSKQVYIASYKLEENYITTQLC